MTHPGSLLVDYVDGTLDGAARTDVQAHLATCATCRQEVALARAARTSLRSLPAAAPPAGLADAALAAASAARSPSPTDIAAARMVRRPSAGRWIGAAAAIAAVLVLLAVVSPRLGSSPSRTAADNAAGGAGVSFSKASAVEVVRANLSQAQLASVAVALGGVQPRSESSPAMGASGPVDVAAPDLQVTAQLPDRLPAASACLSRAWGGGVPGELTRVLLTRFDGTPAYVGLYAVGPGAGLPPTRLQLVVASVDGCRLLASTYARL
jgi:hypothetical protein